MRVCLVTPYAWDRPSEANDHWAAVARAPRGARPRGRDPRAGPLRALLRDGRHRLRQLERGDDYALTPSPRRAAGRRGGPRGARRRAAPPRAASRCRSRSRPASGSRWRGARYDVVDCLDAHLPGPSRRRAAREHRAGRRHLVPPGRGAAARTRTPHVARHGDAVAPRRRGAARRPGPAVSGVGRRPARFAPGTPRRCRRSSRWSPRSATAARCRACSPSSAPPARRSRCCTTQRRRRRARCAPRDPEGRVHVTRRGDARRPGRRAARRVSVFVAAGARQRAAGPRGGQACAMPGRGRRRRARPRSSSRTTCPACSRRARRRRRGRRVRRPAAGRRARCAAGSAPAVARPRPRRRLRPSPSASRPSTSRRAAPPPRRTGRGRRRRRPPHPVRLPHAHGPLRRLRRRRCPTSSQRALELGLGAIAVTDHNTIAGGVAARAYVEEHGLPLHVVVGSEVKTATGEVIGLYLEEEIPRGMPFADTVEAIRAQGALVYVPHPFDRMHAIPDPRCCAGWSTRSTCSRRTTPASTAPRSTARPSASPSATTCWPAPGRTRTCWRGWARASCELPPFEDAGIPAPGAGTGPDRAPSRESAVPAGAEVAPAGKEPIPVARTRACRGCPRPTRSTSATCSARSGRSIPSARRLSPAGGSPTRRPCRCWAPGTRSRTCSC